MRVNLKDLPPVVEADEIKPLLEKLMEGTWSVPDTLEKVARLAELMSKPLRSDDATDALYSIYGDDMLFDALETDTVAADVRPIVKRFLSKMLNHYRKAPQDFKWTDPKAADKLAELLRS